MISEGSCDTEVWSNDAENSVFHHRIKLHVKIYSHRIRVTLKCVCVCVCVLYSTASMNTTLQATCAYRL